MRFKVAISLFLVNVMFEAQSLSNTDAMLTTMDQGYVCQQDQKPVGLPNKKDHCLHLQNHRVGASLAELEKNLYPRLSQRVVNSGPTYLEV